VLTSVRIRIIGLTMRNSSTRAKVLIQIVSLIACQTGLVIISLTVLNTNKTFRFIGVKYITFIASFA